MLALVQYCFAFEFEHVIDHVDTPTFHVVRRWTHKHINKSQHGGTDMMVHCSLLTTRLCIRYRPVHESPALNIITMLDPPRLDIQYVLCPTMSDHVRPYHKPHLTPVIVHKATETSCPLHILVLITHSSKAGKRRF